MFWRVRFERDITSERQVCRRARLRDIVGRRHGVQDAPLSPLAFPSCRAAGLRLRRIGSEGEPHSIRSGPGGESATVIAEGVIERPMGRARAGPVPAPECCARAARNLCGRRDQRLRSAAGARDPDRCAVRLILTAGPSVRGGPLHQSAIVRPGRGADPAARQALPGPLNASE